MSVRLSVWLAYVRLIDYLSLLIITRRYQAAKCACPATNRQIIGLAVCGVYHKVSCRLIKAVSIVKYNKQEADDCSSQCSHWGLHQTHHIDLSLPLPSRGAHQSPGYYSLMTNPLQQPRSIRGNSLNNLYLHD